MPMSGVYENVFQTSEISILLSLRNELLFTLCVRTPSTRDFLCNAQKVLCNNRHAYFF